MSSDRKRTAGVLVAFVVIYLALGLVSYTQKSSTWDEPQHLLRGLLAWRGDHRMDPEHPPLLRLWAALPVAGDPTVRIHPGPIDQISPADWVGHRQFQFAHQTLYELNDADRLLYRARFMILLLGALLGILIFSWVNELFGRGPATAALALYTVEPNLLAHATLVTTDFGAACFMFGTLYFLWRTTRRCSRWNVTGLIGFFALALAAKFTTLMIVPALALLLAVDGFRHRRLLPAAAIFAGMLGAAWLLLWATHGFRYAPSANPDWLYRFQDGSPFGDKFPVFARLAIWADDRHLVPNASAQGFLLGQIKAQSRGAYLAGEFRSTGWWYYFPVAFLIKTPVGLLALLVAGLGVIGFRWRQLWEAALVVVLPVVVIVGLAMTQKLNIGLRHILPVYPCAILLASAGLAAATHRWRALALAGIAAAAVESAVAYPSPLAFFNLAAGGPGKGSEYLVDSNLDWGQDLKGLKRWMEAHAVGQINLCYFGTAAPGYYGIRFTALPGHGFFERGGAPQLPGYVAISATNLRGVYFPEALRQFYAPLLRQEPVAQIGFSIFVYRVEQPWWP
jgi:hypothetical protein